ncbi:MAG: HlyD family efflux transporter periplasmic adaptor subunit [Acidobacteria bacterium]|nr:HlyD family efflux transporter periplasmic adaptor subunit [Acidobacteriota bacterium]
MKYTHEDTPSKNKTRGKTLGRILALLLLIICGLLIFQYRNDLSTKLTKVFAATEEDPVPVTALTRQPFRLTVPATGEIVGLETTSVVTPETSRGSLKLSWLIPEGTFVQSGDTVVRFDGTDAQLSLEEEENNLRENQLNTQITTLNQSTDEKVLEMDRTDAEMDYEYAMTVMPEDESIFSKWDIITAQADANYAKERIDFLNHKAKTQRRIARSDQQILNIERNKAQSEISVIQSTLNSLELKATKPGLALYQREHREDPQIGDEYHPGQALVELVNLDILQARIYVLERDGGNLEKGLPVVLKLDAIPDKEFHGTISSVSSVAGSLERDSVLRYFTCDVAISDAGRDLKRIRPGMNLEADVVLEEYDSVFVVPSSAVTYREKDSVVYVKNEDDFNPRTVETGLGSHGEAVILDGIEEGELIALRNPYETRQLYLPDFSKGTQSDMFPGGMPGGMPNPSMMRRMMGGRGGGPPGMRR